MSNHLSLLAAWDDAEGVRRASELFLATYGGRPDGVWAAPGRVNLIGEHLAGMLVAEGLRHAPVFTITESRLGEDGLLPPGQVDQLRDWLARVWQWPAPRLPGRDVPWSEWPGVTYPW